MISHFDRRHAVELIDEAVTAGRTTTQGLRQPGAQCSHLPTLDTGCGGTK